MFAACLIV